MREGESERGGEGRSQRQLTTPGTPWDTGSFALGAGKRPGRPVRPVLSPAERAAKGEEDDGPRDEQALRGTGE